MGSLNDVQVQKPPMSERWNATLIWTITSMAPSPISSRTSSSSFSTERSYQSALSGSRKV